MDIHGFLEDGSIGATIDGVRMVVPDDMDNRHRQKIGAWEAEGNTIPPYVPPPEPPAINLPLTKRQVIAAMSIGGSILDPDGSVTAAIGAISDPVARALALNDWRNAPYYLRAHPLFNDTDLLAAMGLNSAAIDGLWALAAQQPK